MVSVGSVTRELRQTNKELKVQLESIGYMIEELVTLLNTEEDESQKKTYRMQLRTIDKMCMHLGIGYEYKYDENKEETIVFITKTKSWA